VDEDKKLEELYNQITEIVAEQINDGYEVIEIAPIMIRVALELYRTTMGEEDYESMVEFIYENRNQINVIVSSGPSIH
jgi:predicted secreted protein